MPMLSQQQLNVFIHAKPLYSRRAAAVAQKERFADSCFPATAGGAYEYKRAKGQTNKWKSQL